MSAKKSKTNSIMHSGSYSVFKETFFFRLNNQNQMVLQGGNASQKSHEMFVNYHKIAIFTWRNRSVGTMVL